MDKLITFIIMLQIVQYKILKNKPLNRRLTNQELCAVEWYVTKILYSKPEHCHNSMKSIISGCNIKNIVKDFRKHVGDLNYEEKRRKHNELLRKVMGKQLINDRDKLVRGA